MLEGDAPNRLAGALLPIPAKGDRRQTLDGYSFEFRAERWEIPGEGTTHGFNFELIGRVCIPALETSLREGLADLLMARAVSSVKNSVDAMNRLLSFIEREDPGSLPLKEINGEALESYLLVEGDRRDNVLKPLLETFNTWNRPGLSPCGWAAIKDRSFKRVVPFIDVLTLDVETGPYMDSELALIEGALQNAYETGRIGAEKYITVMIFQLFGQRPATNAKLKCGDVRTPKHDGSDQVTIRFPIVKKQRKGRGLARTHGAPRPVPVFFAHVLESYLDELFVGIIEPDRAGLPLFRAESPAFRVLNGKPSKGNGAAGYIGHVRALALGKRYQKIITDLQITSPRTSERLNATPNRARHTVGTQMAMQGAPAAAIAAWLGHDSEVSCEAYVTVATQHFQLMAELLNGRFKHLAGRFFGEVIAQDAVEEVDLSSIISDIESEGGPTLGSCADGGCKAVESLDAPYACFTCPNFQLSAAADLRPLLLRLAERQELAAHRGDSMMTPQIERLIGVVHAAHEAQEAFHGKDN